ncbi:MAG: exodeoxyribonuclease VII small subunit [Clostridiales bacterium]|jgi:exodeoxyribonuclease VII small subunit|nr:exodeoxyribonuclease VII small subunit [Clostridiales bacterium]
MNLKKQTFEQSAARLEEIVKKLEMGNIPIDESLKLFEEGTKLAEFCNSCLDNAQQKIIQLTELEAEDANAEQ